MTQLKTICYYFFLLIAPLAVITGCDDEDDPLLLNPNGNGTKNNSNANNAAQNKLLARLEFPAVKGGSSEVITHSTTQYGLNYAIEWDHTLRAQRWTCFAFYPENSVTKWARGNWYNTSWGGDPFQLDPSVPAQEQPSVKGEFSSSYYPGGSRNDYYNRGHICASQDRMCSQEVNEQTFYMTNMMPQVYTFNGGIWSKMEQQVRNWNKNSLRDTLYVVKGGTIDHEEQILDRTRSGFIVPRYFFMALLCKNSQGYKALGFWVEHLNTDHSNDNLGQYVVNIDELEELTGIDFFCNLPDDVEKQVEGLSPSLVKTLWGVK